MNKPFVLHSTVTEQGAVRALGNQSLLLNRFISVGSRSYAIGLSLGFSRVLLNNKRLHCAGTNTCQESWSACRSHFLNILLEILKEFENEEEFLVWKNTIENCTNSNFVSLSGGISKKSGTCYKYFDCKQLRMGKLCLIEQVGLERVADLLKVKPYVFSNPFSWHRPALEATFVAAEK